MFDVTFYAIFLQLIYCSTLFHVPVFQLVLFLITQHDMQLCIQVVSDHSLYTYIIFATCQSSTALTKAHSSYSLLIIKITDLQTRKKYCNLNTCVIHNALNIKCNKFYKTSFLPFKKLLPKSISKLS